VSDLRNLSNEDLLKMYQQASAAPQGGGLSGMSDAQLLEMYKGGKPREWSDVPGEALKNAPASTVRLAENIVTPLLHPVDTATAMGELATGLRSKAQAPVDAAVNWVRSQFDPEGAAASNAARQKYRAQQEGTANAVGQAVVDRYGSGEALKNTLATDPVGALADASSVLTLGGGLAAKAPGMVGQVGRGAAAVGSAIDPVTNAGRAAELVAKGIGYGASSVLGRTTGVGGTVVRTAAEEGAKGGASGKVFRENLRGASPEGMVDMADSALGQMRKARADSYNTGMSGLRADPAVLEFKPIVDDFASSISVGTFKGKTINRSAVGTQQQILDVLTEWRALDPAEFHTPAGFDALKQTIGDIRSNTQPGTASRVVADRVYNSVKSQIEKQAPSYAKTMADYAEASDKLKQLEKTFARTANASDETAVNRLLSTARNNVTSNYSQRGDMMRELAKYEPNLPAAIAGQTLNSYAPRGLTANIAGTGGLAAMMANPALAAAAPAFMPRVVGEAAYGAGRIGGLLSEGAQAVGATGQNIRGSTMALNQMGKLEELRRRSGLLSP